MSTNTNPGFDPAEIAALKKQCEAEKSFFCLHFRRRPAFWKRARNGSHPICGSIRETRSHL